MSDTVEYRPIEGYPGYRVGSDGSVWTIRNRSQWKKLAAQAGKRGYLRVTLNPGAKKYLVHHLVLGAFVSPRPPGQECLHGPDFDPSNNNISNLKWGTRMENVADKRNAKGESHYRSKFTADQVREIRTNPHGVSLRKWAKRLGCSMGAISHIRAGRSWVGV